MRNRSQERMQLIPLQPLFRRTAPYAADAIGSTARHTFGRRSRDRGHDSSGLVAFHLSHAGPCALRWSKGQELVDWGWRIPYFFGMLIGPAGLYVRSKVVDTPEFIEAEKPATIPISDLLRRHPLPVLLALGISIISNSSFYLTLYIPTFGVKRLHLPEYTGFVATLVGGLILAIGCPRAAFATASWPRYRCPMPRTSRSRTRRPPFPAPLCATAARHSGPRFRGTLPVPPRRS
jgi:MFS family permease